MRDPRWVGVPGAARRVEASETFVRLLVTMELVPSRTAGTGAHQRLEVDVVELANQVPKYRSVAAQQKLIRAMAHRLEALAAPDRRGDRAGTSPAGHARRRRSAPAADPTAPGTGEVAPAANPDATADGAAARATQPGGALIPLAELSGLFDRLADAERRAAKAEAEVTHYRERIQLMRQRERDAEAATPAVAPKRSRWRLFR